MVRLIVTAGPLVGRRYEIDDELALGGDATVRIVGGELQVEDLGSSDGTWVDGRQIDRPTRLRDGAELRIGATTFIVEIDAAGGGRARTRVGIPVLSPERDAPAPAGFGQPTASPEALAPLVPVAEPPRQPYAEPAVARRRRADTRMWLPAAVTFAAIIATAVALVLYFALR